MNRLKRLAHRWAGRLAVLNTAMAGYAAYKLDLPEPALKHLQKAIHLDPKKEDYYLDLAEFLGNNNALDALIAVLEGGVQVVPQSAKVQSALAVAYLLILDLEKAVTVLQKVLRANPAYEVGHKLLADCYYRAQEWRKLKTAAAELRRLNDKNSIGWYYGAEAEYRLLRAEKGRSSESIQGYLQEATKLDPDDWRAPLLSGKVLLEQERRAEAVDAFRKAAARNPDEPAAHYLLATTLRELGKIEESKSAFETFKQAQANEKNRQFRRMLVDIR